MNQERGGGGGGEMLLLMLLPGILCYHGFFRFNNHFHITHINWHRILILWLLFQSFSLHKTFQYWIKEFFNNFTWINIDLDSCLCHNFSEEYFLRTSVTVITNLLFAMCSHNVKHRNYLISFNHQLKQQQHCQIITYQKQISSYL